MLADFIFDIESRNHAETSGRCSYMLKQNNHIIWKQTNKSFREK